MKKIWHENSLSIVLLGLFFVAFIGGQVLFGEKEYNSDRQTHGLPAIGLVQYLGTPHFLEATMENWESEFLQMGLYVFLTAFFIKQGPPNRKAWANPRRSIATRADSRIRRTRPGR